MMSGLSGNEIYCLAQKGWTPGNIVVGNSVYSLGFLGSITSGLRMVAGGEIENITRLISDGRHAAIQRLEEEANQEGAHGLTGVVSELKTVSGLTEFLAIGSAIRGQDYHGPFFTTACSGQDLFCQIDAGYEPRHFVIGNVAYALGVTRGLMGTFKQIARRGEVKEFSDMYNHTRHLALQRQLPRQEDLAEGALAEKLQQLEIVDPLAGCRESTRGARGRRPRFRPAGRRGQRREGIARRTGGLQCRLECALGLPRRVRSS